MKNLLLLAFTSLCLQLSAQRIMILKVDDQLIYADTTGAILINQRFDEVEEISQNYNTYIVYKNYKRGIVRDYKIIIPPIYNQITVVNPNQTNHAYILRKDQKHALANGLGELLTSFDYKDIWEFDIEHERRYSKTDYFLLKIGDSSKLASLNENNHFRFEIDALVNRITTEYGCVITHKGKMKAMYQLEAKTGHLVKRFDFREVTYEFYPESFYIVDPKANKVEQYNYSCKLLRTIKGTTKVPEYPYEYENDMEAINVAEYVVEDNSYSYMDLITWRNQIKYGNYSHLMKEFELATSTKIQIKQQLYYLSDITVTGSKGKFVCEVKAEYNGLNADIRDTTFVVDYDEVDVSKTIHQLYTVVPVRKGKNWGVIDVKGREVLAPAFTAVKRIHSDQQNEFIVAHTKALSYLFYHDVKANTLDTLIVGKPKDEYRIEGNQIFVNRRLNKNKLQVGVTKWYYLPLDIPEVKAINLLTFYDSISTHPDIPIFSNCYKNGKAGLISSSGLYNVPAIYDSLQLKMVYKVEQGYYQPYTARYQKLQPIILAYKEGVVSVFAYNGYDLKGSVIKGNTTNNLIIANDGLFLINDLGNNTIDLYSLTGQKLTKAPILKHPKKEMIAQFNKKYWYVQCTDSKGKDILIGKNGAWFELPEK